MPRIAAMGLKHSEIFVRIQQLVASDNSVSAGMGEIIAICSLLLQPPGRFVRRSLSLSRETAKL
jgi:hypothetical protein